MPSSNNGNKVRSLNESDPEAIKCNGLALDLYMLVRKSYSDERDQGALVAMLACTYLLNVAGDEKFFTSMRQALAEHIETFDPYEPDRES